METVWMATRSAGKFRVGQYYTKGQLGVLGRMAIRAGYLIPTEAPVRLTKRSQEPAAPRKRRAPRKTKGVGDEPGGAQSGSGEGVRDQGSDG